LLDETPYVKLHDKRGYKFFCFSNIFPPEDAKAGATRNLLISSPDAGMINALEKSLKELQEDHKTANVGEMSFGIEAIFRLEPKIGRSCTLITGTPIVVRIPKENYEKYGIKPSKDYDYVYWRKIYSLSAFVKQLEDNLLKKYKEFYGETIGETFTIFQKAEFLKQVSNSVVVDGREITIIGTLWRFAFESLDKKQARLLTFAIDCGFGELNPLGFGFVNLERPAKSKSNISSCYKFKHK
jgi:CRISPR-associated endoribonuclease Cas6